jgi:hypothetical protein
MATFLETLNPTPFGFFDSDPDFQSESDPMITFVKRKLGDDVLSVELTKKEIWSCFEEACLEYARRVHEMRTKNELINVLGLPTGSTDLTNKYPKRTLEFLFRMAEPYASYAGVGGSHNALEAYIDLEIGRQDYDIYKELKVFSGSLSGSNLYESLPSGSKGKIRVLEVMHFEPLASQQFLLNASNITNFLATNFNYESYVNSTVFYVLPVFEDVLRRQMLETAFRVRRSNYSYRIMGSRLRIYPIPSSDLNIGKLFLRVVAGQQNPLESGQPDDGSELPIGIPYEDDTICGISGPNDIPFGQMPYETITEPGRQWIRQYTLALAKELLGLIRSKFDSVPVPNAEVKLNGSELVTQAREDRDRLVDQLLEFLDELTYDKIMEREASIAENVQKQLKFTPMPVGKGILIG